MSSPPTLIPPNFYINYFGSILPFNADTLPESSNHGVGPGTVRPIGFSQMELADLYWTVKSFDVDITIQILSKGIDGSDAAPTAWRKNLKGSTKNFNLYKRRNRKCTTDTDGKDSKFKYDQYSNIINTSGCSSLQVEKSFFAIDTEVDESTLCDAGPCHSFIQQDIGNVFISFSDIKYENNSAWPVIVINISAPGYYTSSLFALGSTAVGSVQFAGHNVQLYSVYNPLILSSNFVGKITVGTKCCDRFKFDGDDGSSCDCSTNYEYPLPYDQESNFFLERNEISGKFGVSNAWGIQV
jgi:hypothetical protein